MNKFSRLIQVALIVLAYSLSSVVQAQTAAQKPSSPAKPSLAQNVHGQRMGCNHPHMKNDTKCLQHGMQNGHMKHMSEHMQKMHSQPMKAESPSAPSTGTSTPAKTEDGSAQASQ